MRQALINKRKEMKMTQKETSELIGVSLRMYQYLEQGKREGKGWIWDRISKTFATDQSILRQIVRK